MKVRAVRKNIEATVAMGAHPSLSRYEVSLGHEYIVFTVDCYYDSRKMERSILYGIEDEYGRLMLYPAALFEVTDARASKYWLAGYSDGSFYLRPQEFIDNVYLSDDIHEDLPGARAAFREIKARFESEAAE
ncbi:MULTISPECIES: hypothetical protein [Stenotrophomonas]|uniref:hypothetical protein n=1 Tax=Stenotrophomonas TaxID=40323 RepID=UPI0011130ED2|nr:hypothetical protein [Stenotrophomonas sp. HMSC10F06]